MVLVAMRGTRHGCWQLIPVLTVSYTCGRSSFDRTVCGLAYLSWFCYRFCIIGANRNNSIHIGDTLFGWQADLPCRMDWDDGRKFLFYLCWNPAVPGTGFGALWLDECNDVNKYYSLQALRLSCRRNSRKLQTTAKWKKKPWMLFNRWKNIWIASHDGWSAYSSGGVANDLIYVQACGDYVTLFTQKGNS